jgi:hypothetical protein
MTATETIPTTWDDVRDSQFFCITAHLFSPEFCCGAGVLLASYDAEDLVGSPAGPQWCPQPRGLHDPVVVTSPVAPNSRVV